LRTSAFRP